MSTLVVTSFSLSILKKSFDELISLTKSVERLSKIGLLPPVLISMACNEKGFWIYNPDQKKQKAVDNIGPFFELNPYHIPYHVALDFA